MNLLLPDMQEPWPHQFTKNGKGYEIAEGKYAQTYICVHCLNEYVQNLVPGQRLPEWTEEPCPARNTSREMKRILR